MVAALSVFSSPFFASRPQTFRSTTFSCSYCHSINSSPASFPYSLKRLDVPHRHRTRKNFIPKVDDGDDVDVPDDYYMEDEDFEELDNRKDYEIDYEPVSAFPPTGIAGEGEIPMLDSNPFASKEWESVKLVDYRIDEDEFHKISLLACDFFIRKHPDPDNDVYDFREIYVTPPDTDVYAIPKVLAPMPQKYIRCSQSDFGCYHSSEPIQGEPRVPLLVTKREILKIFLIKHYRNRRLDDPEFVLDFEEIYVIDSKTKTITRAKVLVTAPEGKSRDRKRDLLKVRDGGTSFKVTDMSEWKHPVDVLQEKEWAESRKEMERYLRKFEGFSHSNWF